MDRAVAAVIHSGIKVSAKASPVGWQRGFAGIEDDIQSRLIKERRHGPAGYEFIDLLLPAFVTPPFQIDQRHAVVVVMAEYALRLQRRAMAASEKAHQAQFRYHRLKQQVNPHFLFNSLNVLDYLIQEQPREDASRYTHKLAEVYRYMIKSEDESTVRLRDEMDFVAQYVDLLKVRFPEGLEIGVDIPEEALSRSVVPCAVQLLIENATKHNAVQPANPLRVGVRVEDDRLVVTNNRIPKITHRPASTGLGLQYIRQQYQDLSGQAISILEDEHRYTVTLPLL